MRRKGKGELMAADRDYCARCPGPSTQSSTRRAIWAPVLSKPTYSAELRPHKIPPQRARSELPCTRITRMPAPVSRAPRAGAGAFVPCRPSAAAALSLHPRCAPCIAGLSSPRLAWSQQLLEVQYVLELLRQNGPTPSQCVRANHCRRAPASRCGLPTMVLFLRVADKFHFSVTDSRKGAKSQQQTCRTGLGCRGCGHGERRQRRRLRWRP